MNELQQATLDYLTSGDGTTSLRDDALHSLVDCGLLNAGQFETGTRAIIEKFLEDERDNGNFCDDGLNRFHEAVLGPVPEPEPVGPRTDEIVVTLQLDITHNSGDTPGFGTGEINRIVTDITKMVLLASGKSSNGEPWKVVDGVYDQWNWGVHC